MLINLSAFQVKFLSSKFLILVNTRLALAFSEMLSNIPVVDRAIWVTSCQDLGIAWAIAHIWLTVVDVVLMKCLLGLNHGVRIELSTVEENSAASKGILTDARSLRASVARVEWPCKCPLAISLLLESERNVVKAAANVSIVTDEASRKNWVAVVYDSLWLRLGFTIDTLCRELREMHLAVMRCVS